MFSCLCVLRHSTMQVERILQDNDVIILLERFLCEGR